MKKGLEQHLQFEFHSTILRREMGKSMKKKVVILLTVLVCILLCACNEQSGAEEMNVYYLNADGNALIQTSYPKTDVEGALEKLKTHSVLSKEVKVTEYKCSNGYLELYFSSAYANVSKSTEVLIRAAIVQTMVQVENVSFVSFYVDGQPLTDSDGNAIGLMRAEDFVQSTGSSIDSYQTTDLKLYFANDEGKVFSVIKKSGVRYNVNSTIERLVVEQLIKGTNSSGAQSTVPKNTMILGVSVKEGICYVNLDSKFLSESYDLSPEVAVYSIVNSVIANGSVTKVQILVDGASDVVYKNAIDLSRPLEWNESILKEK